MELSRFSRTNDSSIYVFFPDFEAHLQKPLELEPLDHIKHNPQSVPPLDGGSIAWIQVAGSWCLYFATWGLVNSFGVFQAYYGEDLLRNESPSRISWIGSLQLCLFVAGTIFVGPLYDVGYLKHLLLSGSFLTVFGMMMTSLCTRYWEFMLAQGICLGVGMTCLLVPSLALVPAYFSRRRGLAVGISATGSSIGAIVFAVLFEQLTPIIGFGWTTRVIGFVLLASLILPIFGLRKRVAHSPRRSLVDKKALTEVPFLILGVVMTLAFIGQFIPYFYIQFFSVQKGILVGSQTRINQYLVIFLNCGSFVGRLLPNIIADRIGPLNTLIPCTIVTAIIAFTWIKVHNLAGLVSFAVFYGCFSGSFVALTPVVWAAITPDLKRLGTRIGMMTVCMAFGLLMGTPIAGILIRDGGRDFLPLQVFCGVTVMAAGVLLVLCRITKSGSSFTVKV